MVPTEAEEVSKDQLIKGLEYQDKDLDLTLGDGEPWEVYKQGSDLLALSRVPGVLRASHISTGMHLEPCLSLPHSSSFQERVLEVLMSSLLIPLSGESNCYGRAGGRHLLLRQSCCHVISSRSSPVPGRSSPDSPVPSRLSPIPHFAAS